MGPVASSRITVAVAVALGTAVPACAVRAQEPPEAGAPLEVIIVTATRREVERAGRAVQHGGARSGGARTVCASPNSPNSRAPCPGLYVADQGPRGGNLLTVRGLNVSSINASESVGNGTGGTRRDLPRRYPVVRRPEDARHGARRGAARSAGHALWRGHTGRRHPLPAQSARPGCARCGVRRSSLCAGRKRRQRPRRPRHGQRAPGRGPPGLAHGRWVTRTTRASSTTTTSCAKPGVSNPQPDFDDPADVAANLRDRKTRIRRRPAADASACSGRRPTRSTRT